MRANLSRGEHHMSSLACAPACHRHFCHAMSSPSRSADASSQILQRWTASTRTAACRAAQLVRRTAPGTAAFDILGLGQAMSDYSGLVSHEFLRQHHLPCGGRRVISAEERNHLLASPDLSAFKLHAAGSLANTLAGYSLLQSAGSMPHPHASEQQPARTCMAGPIGDDHLGEFFKSHFARVGVQWIEKPLSGMGTGTVMVLTTPDAQRTFLSYPGPPCPLHFSSSTYLALASARCMVVEGYLWEMPNAATEIDRAMRCAKANGCCVVMTMADVSVVRRHCAAMRSAMQHADIIFANAEEAQTLVSGSSTSLQHRHSTDDPASIQNSTQYSAEEAAHQLGALCHMAVVTDGARGSYVAALGHVEAIPPHWAPEPPVDTCGAGDAYAAGFLHGYLSGMPVRAMGDFAAMTASAVISHHGPQLLPEHAQCLATCRPVNNSQNTLQLSCATDEADAMWPSRQGWACEAWAA